MQRLAQPCGAVCTNASERKPRGVAPAEGHRPTPVAAYFADAPQIVNSAVPAHVYLLELVQTRTK
jgi:hypothetical protein